MAIRSDLFQRYVRETAPNILFFMALAFLLSTGAARAQSGKGAIAGRAIDSAGGVLPGAQVDLDPTAATGVSNNLGEFVINDLAPGPYKVVISFVGLAPFPANRTV